MIQFTIIKDNFKTYEIWLSLFSASTQLSFRLRPSSFINSTIVASFMFVAIFDKICLSKVNGPLS